MRWKVVEAATVNDESQVKNTKRNISSNEQLTTSKTNNNIWEIGSARLYGSQAIGFDNSIYDTILQSENDRRPYDDILAESINQHNYIFTPYLIYQNINKQSTTSTNNIKDQEFFNRLNSINPNNYL